MNHSLLVSNRITRERPYRFGSFFFKCIRDRLDQICRKTDIGKFDLKIRRFGKCGQNKVYLAY